MAETKETVSVKIDNSGNVDMAETKETVSVKIDNSGNVDMAETKETVSVKIDNSGNVTFYKTIDGFIILNIEDISFIKFCQVLTSDNAIDVTKSYFEVYMRGNHNGLKISYRDGIQLSNILMSEKYGLYIEEETINKTINSTSTYFSVPEVCSYRYGDLNTLNYSLGQPSSCWINAIKTAETAETAETVETT